MNDSDKEINIQICHQPLQLEFTDITFIRKGKNGSPPKEILKGVSGKLQPGRLTAILGPSGAGKTSLLNALSGFRTAGIKGSIKVNGKERILQKFRKECCYITQEFAMQELLTVKETFKSTADLKLGRKIGEEKKDLVISDIVSILNLTSCLNTQVKNLSGGEKKRLSIGLELITNPPIMFFDEPTSGLDSSSSIQVISHLKMLAKGGRTIVCVIHQPSSRIFEMFDDVYILVDGRCLYNGTVENMLPVLENAGFTCPKYYNRADFAIEVACKERGDNLNSLFSLTRLTNFNNKVINEEFREKGNFLNCNTQEQESLQPMLLQDKNIKNTAIEVVPMDQSNQIRHRKYRTSSWLQFWVLLKRTFLCNSIRNLQSAKVRFFSQIVVGLLMGMVFYNIGNEGSKVSINTSFVFFSLMFVFLSNAVPTVQTFPSEAPVFMREHLNNWYSMKAFYFSQQVADLPLQIICPTTYLLITFFMTNQPYTLERIWMVLLLGFVTTIMSQAKGYAYGAIFNAELGAFVLPVSSLPMLLFSGFFIPLNDLPPYLKWFSYVSYFRYVFEGTMVALYGNNRPNLDCSIGYCPHKYPEKFLRDLGMENANYWVDILGIIVWTVVFRMAFYGILKWKLYRIRGY